MKLTPEQFAELIASQIDAGLKKYGLDKIDQKFAMPPAQNQDEEDKFKNMKPEERVATFFKALIFKDNDTLKALAVGSDTAGGYLVPEEFKNMIIEELPNVTVMRNVARVIPVTSNDGYFPTVGAKPTVSYVNENSTISASDAQFNQINWLLKKVAGLVPVSEELMADSPFNLTQLLTRWFAEAVGEFEDEKFTNGSGTGEAKGFRTETFTNTVAQSGTTLSYGDLVSVQKVLKQKYRKRGIWMTSPKGIELLAKMTDANGNPLLYNPAQSDITTLFGRPIYENENIPENLGTGNDETEIYFGDFQNYFIFNRQDYQVKMTTEGAGAFENDQAIIKVTTRHDGKVAIEKSFAKLSNVK